LQRQQISGPHGAGVIADESYNTTFVSKCMAGALEKGWLGLKGKGPRDNFEITAYRCASCGYLESDAAP
jgi:hypothetical protein